MDLLQAVEVARTRVSRLDSRNGVEAEVGLTREVVVGEQIVIVEREEKHGFLGSTLFQIGRAAKGGVKITNDLPLPLRSSALGGIWIKGEKFDPSRHGSLFSHSQRLIRLFELGPEATFSS